MPAPRSHKPISSIQAWALAFGCVIGWGAFIMPGTSLLPVAGPFGSVAAMAASTVLMLAIAGCYSFMVGKHPVGGGAFTYALKTFGRTHGYICGWFLVFAYVTIIPMNATALSLVSRNLMDNLLEIGPSYSVAGYETFLPELLLALVVLAIVAFLLVRGVRVVVHLQVVFALCLLVGVAGIIIGVFTSPAASPENLQPLYGPQEGFPLLGFAAIVAVAPWAFLGFDCVTLFGGDTSAGTRGIGLVMLIAILLGFAVYALLCVVAVMVVPAGYPSWVEYIADLPNLGGAAAVPVFNAAAVTLGETGRILLEIGTLGAVFTGIIGFFIASTRLIFCMAQEDLLPEWFKASDPTYGTPRHAIFFVFLVSMVACCFGRDMLGWLLDISAVGGAIAFLYTSLAVWKNARGESRPGWLLLGGFCALASAVFIFLLVTPITAINSVLSPGSYVFMVAWIALGINFFTPEYQASPTGIQNMPDDFDELPEEARLLH